MHRQDISDDVFSDHDVALHLTAGEIDGHSLGVALSDRPSVVRKYLYVLSFCVFEHIQRKAASVYENPVAVHQESGSICRDPVSAIRRFIRYMPCHVCSFHRDSAAMCSPQKPVLFEKAEVPAHCHQRYAELIRQFFISDLFSLPNQGQNFLLSLLYDFSIIFHKLHHSP